MMIGIPKQKKGPISWSGATKLVEYDGCTYIVPIWAKYLTRDKGSPTSIAWDIQPIQDEQGHWLLPDHSCRWAYAPRKLAEITSFIVELGV